MSYEKINLWRETANEIGDEILHSRLVKMIKLRGKKYREYLSQVKMITGNISVISSPFGFNSL